MLESEEHRRALRNVLVRCSFRWPLPHCRDSLSVSRVCSVPHLPTIQTGADKHGTVRTQHGLIKGRHAGKQPRQHNAATKDAR